MMNRSNCAKNPYSCDNSIFFERVNAESDKMVRWVECYEWKDGCLRLENGAVCSNMPFDWWAEYLKGCHCG